MDSPSTPNPLPGRTARINVPPASENRAPRANPPAHVPVVDPYAKTVVLKDNDRHPPADDRASDSLFQHFTILDKIGDDGGMGVVYLAKDKHLRRFVAIKRLNAHAQSVPSLRHRFLQEARAAAALTHIHIVHIYALGEDQDGPYIAMEYIAGKDGRAVHGQGPEPDRPNPPQTLDNFVTQHGPLPMEEAVTLMVKVGRAIAYAHSCGVIHRDIKPGNVLLDKSGEPKIVDFGLARLMNAGVTQLTVPGEKLLSLGYGAPEQESDASLSDERADVYGLGALLFFAITGQNPRYFREQDVPVPLRDVMVQALATDREQRLPTAVAFTEALQAIQSKTHIETPTVKTIWRCKWCDTVNPLTLRFCAECGWDGGETCPECGLETFVGVQYCGTCGADARAYESLNHVLQRMRAAAEMRAFDRVISLSGRVHGFEAAGPSGRRLLKEVQTMREQSERNLSRRDELTDQIPLEMQAENYERALAFIHEIRTLDENQRLYEAEERRIPDLILSRDLIRARRAIRQRDWDTATRICNEIFRHAPENAACLRFRRQITIWRWVREGFWIGASVAALLLVYLLALPPMARAVKSPPVSGTWRTFFRPAWLCYSSGTTAEILEHYNNLWGAPNLAACFTAAGSSAPVVKQPALPPSAELRTLQQAYTEQVRTFNADQQSFAAAWSRNYMNELSALMENRQSSGDFEGWRAAKSEREQFDASHTIGDIPGNGEFPDLTQLMRKYRDQNIASRMERCNKLVKASKKYLQDLRDQRGALTRKGEMKAANDVDDEIQRVQISSSLQDAKAELVAVTALADKPEPNSVLLAAAQTNLVAEIGPLRAHYQEQLDGIAQDYDRKMKEWPGKYKTALTGLMDSFRQQSSFDYWATTKKELDRFEADPQIQVMDVVAAPVSLANLQQNHIALLAQYRKERANNLISAANQLTNQLVRLQGTFMHKGNMELAAAVNAEIHQLQAIAEYIAARQELEPPAKTP